MSNIYHSRCNCAEMISASGNLHKPSLKGRSSRMQTSDSTRCRHGAYAVEMAFALPVLFLIIFSGFELMHYFKVRHTVNQAAYAAARQLVVPGGNVNQAINAANRIARVNLLQVDGITVTPQTITRDTRFVTVAINVRFLNEWSVARLFAGQTITGRCTLAHENRSIYGD